MEDAFIPILRVNLHFHGKRLFISFPSYSLCFFFRFFSFSCSPYALLPCAHSSLSCTLIRLIVRYLQLALSFILHAFVSKLQTAECRRDLRRGYCIFIRGKWAPTVYYILPTFNFFSWKILSILQTRTITGVQYHKP